MSYNGSGTFLINTAGQPVVSGTVISSTAFNALTADLATGLSTAITKDGQTTVTANIPMSTYKFTGLGVGSAATDSANLSQVQSTVTKLLNSVSGADTITATASPTLAAYAAGQMFYFVAAGDNTTSVTLNIDSLGAKAVTRDGATALAAADIKSGEVVVVVYDGTRFQVVSQLNSAGDARFANVSIASSLYVGGVSTFVGNAGFSANVSIASALSVGGVAAITGATTIGGNLTLSGGTANGVLYLNGSKVATSGSALVFDGTNLGLGTASPGSKLSLGTGTTSTTDTACSFRLYDVGGANGNNYGFGFNVSDGRFAYTAGLTGYHAFFTANTERMRLDASGNLGIGTASPGSKLDVNGSGRFRGFDSGYYNENVIAIGNASYDPKIGMSSNGGYRWNMRIADVGASGAGNFVIRYEEGSLDALVMTRTGNLGVGTASPQAKLEVAAGQLFINQDQRLQWNIAGSTTIRADIRGTSANAIVFGNRVGGVLTDTMVLDGSGNLGLGVTPSAWAASFNAFQFGASGRASALFANGANDFWQVSNAFFNGSNFIYYANGAATAYNQVNGAHNWRTAPSGTAGNAISFTQAMTLDSSGNLGIGVTSPTVRLDVAGSGNTTSRARFEKTGTGKILQFGADRDTTAVPYIGSESNHDFSFITNNTERGRFTAGGYFKASNDGTYDNSTGAYHEFKVTNSARNTYFTSSNASPFGPFIQYSNAAPNGTGNEFLYCTDNAGGGTIRATIRSNGGLANYSANDVNLSDERVKTDIAPLGSMWAKFKALEIVTFKYKDQTHDDDNIGVIAQQVESVAPEFVDADGWGETPEDGVPLKSIYTADMYHAAIKALQEAMARIETLEAKVTALESK